MTRCKYFVKIIFANPFIGEACFCIVLMLFYIFTRLRQRIRQLLNLSFSLSCNCIDLLIETFISVHHHLLRIKLS